MTDAELDALEARLREPDWSPVARIHAAEAIAALRKERDEARNWAYAQRLAKHRSGCACHISDDEQLVSVCEFHREYVTRAETAEARIAELTANVSRLTANPADYRYWEGRCRDAEAERDAALTTVAALADERRQAVEALRPWGLLSDVVLSHAPCDADEWQAYRVCDGSIHCMPLDGLRATQATLARLAPPAGGGGDA